MNINNKYLTALLTLAILAVGFIQVANSDGAFTFQEQLQLGSLVIGGFVTYIAPLTKGNWPAIFKIAGPVLGAALAVLVTAVMEGNLLDGNLLIVIILAMLNAFAAQIGVDARIDTVKEIIANPGTPTSTAVAIDESATQVALKQVA